MHTNGLGHICCSLLSHISLHKIAGIDYDALVLMPFSRCAQLLEAPAGQVPAMQNALL